MKWKELHLTGAMAHVLASVLTCVPPLCSPAPPHPHHPHHSPPIPTDVFKSPRLATKTPGVFAKDMATCAPGRRSASKLGPRQGSSSTSVDRPTRCERLALQRSLSSPGCYVFNESFPAFSGNGQVSERQITPVYIDRHRMIIMAS